MKSSLKSNPWLSRDAFNVSSLPSKKVVPSRRFDFKAVLIFLVASYISLWTFFLYDLRRSHEEAFHYAAIQLQNLTRVYAEEVSSSIDAINYLLIDLRDDWQGDVAHFETLMQHRQVYLDPRIAFSVGIMDAQGILIYASGNRHPPAMNLSDLEHFAFHSYGRGDELHISAPTLMREIDRVAIHFTRPLPRKEGKFNGVIVVSVSPEYFYRFHEAIDLGQDSSIALARIYGDLLARFPYPEQILNKVIQSAPWIGARPDEYGFFNKYSEVDKVERLYAWRVVEKGDLAVVTGQSVDTILTPYYQLRRTYLWVGGAATVFLLLAAWVVQRYRRQRAKAEEKVQHMEEALERSQKLESIGKLTGGVAHDFNNFLQILSSHVQMLDMIAAGNKEIESHLHGMAHVIERGSKLTSQLLTFARRQPLHPTVVDLVKLHRELDSLIQRLVGHDIRVHTSIEEDLWKIRVDSSLLENVILNLAANARDAMDGKGQLSIRLANESIDELRAADYPGITPGEYVMLAMTDTGSGMPPDILEQVFEPFFTTKPAGKGTGLGLPMAYGFVKESDGHIHIDSEVGRGTTIRMYFPRADDEQAVNSSAVTEAPVTGGMETILMVEDNPELRRMVSMMLECAGYRVLKAANPQEALKVLKENEAIDVLFTDVLMPGSMDGVELAKRAKAMHSDLTVILASGSYDVHRSLKDLEAAMGSIDFLQKPYQIEEVDAAIRKLRSKKKDD